MKSYRLSLLERSIRDIDFSMYRNDRKQVVVDILCQLFRMKLNAEIFDYEIFHLRLTAKSEIIKLKSEISRN